MGVYYDWPPEDTDAAYNWAADNTHAAVAYAAMWTHSGQGYGEQTKTEWPDCPGFDYDDGLPDWGCEITEEPGYEYRTVLMWHFYGETFPCPNGWELVASFRVNPEPELFDDDGSPCGHMYIGEGWHEAVYRRKEHDQCDE